MPDPDLASIFSKLNHCALIKLSTTSATSSRHEGKFSPNTDITLLVSSLELAGLGAGIGYSLVVIGRMASAAILVFKPSSLALVTTQCA